MKWDIQNNRGFKISAELGRLLAQQTKFFKRTEHSPEELREYAESRERVRELFKELEQSTKAA
jgi:hypothetical protein